jgi:two-component system response regulator YesN
VFLQKLWLKRRSVILTWLFSYVAILFLPIMLSIIVYYESNKTIHSEIQRANDALLKQVREVIDNQFENIQRLTTEIIWNPRVQALLYSLDTEPEYRYDAYRVSQDLKYYQPSYAFVDEFYVYMNKADTVILPGTIRSSNFAFQTIHQGFNISYNEWLSILTKNDFRGFLPLVRKNDNVHAVNTVAYVSTIAGDKGEKPIGSTVVMIDESRLLQTVENAKLFNGSQVLVMNKDSQVLVSNSTSGNDLSFRYEKFTGESGLFYEQYNGENSEFFYIKSKKSELVYISIVPSSVVWEKANYIRKLTYVSILISILGGGLLTVFFLRKNYNPILGLLQATGLKVGQEYGKEGNEFHYIQQVISNTLNEKERISLRIQQQNNMLRTNVIARLLKGKLDSQIPTEKSLATFNMRLKSDDYAVILLYLEDIDKFFTHIPGDDANQKWKLLQFIITNVVEEIAGQKHQGFVTEIDDMIACLINFSEGDKLSRKDDLLQIVGDSQQFLREKFHIDSTLSISRIQSTIVGISQAYKEALDAMEYKLVMGSREILSYEELQQGDLDHLHTGYYYPLQVEQQLINYVKIGDLEKAEKTLDEIIDQNVSQNLGKSAVSVPLAKCLMFNLVSTMIKTINEIGDVRESFLLKNPKRIERLLACETIKDMSSQLKGILKEVCEYTTVKRKHYQLQAREQTLQGFAGDIVALIESEYSNFNLNISLIGERFGMSPTYLSRLFKEQTGGGLLDQINKVRMDKAKQLLMERKSNINDVAIQVGYHDVNSFIRMFKKYEGITPGKYKETI